MALGLASACSACACCCAAITYAISAWVAAFYRKHRSMPLATAAPHAQPTTRQSMQTAMSCAVLAHWPPCGWPTTDDPTPRPPPPPDSPPPPPVAVIVVTMFQKAVDAFQNVPREHSQPKWLNVMQHGVYIMLKAQYMMLLRRYSGAGNHGPGSRATHHSSMG